MTSPSPVRRGVRTLAGGGVGGDVAHSQDQARLGVRCVAGSIKQLCSDLQADQSFLYGASDVFDLRNVLASLTRGLLWTSDKLEGLTLSVDNVIADMDVLEDKLSKAEQQGIERQLSLEHLEDALDDERRSHRITRATARWRAAAAEICRERRDTGPPPVPPPATNVAAAAAAPAPLQSRRVAGDAGGGAGGCGTLVSVELTDGVSLWRDLEPCMLEAVGSFHEACHAAMKACGGFGTRLDSTGFDAVFADVASAARFAAAVQVDTVELPWPARVLADPRGAAVHEAAAAALAAAHDAQPEAPTPSARLAATAAAHAMLSSSDAAAAADATATPRTGRTLLRGPRLSVAVACVDRAAARRDARTHGRTAYVGAQLACAQLHARGPAALGGETVFDAASYRALAAREERSGCRALQAWEVYVKGDVPGRGGGGGGALLYAAVPKGFAGRRAHLGKTAADSKLMSRLQELKQAECSKARGAGGGPRARRLSGSPSTPLSLSASTSMRHPHGCCAQCGASMEEGGGGGGGGGDAAAAAAAVVAAEAAAAASTDALEALLSIEAEREVLREELGRGAAAQHALHERVACLEEGRAADKAALEEATAAVAASAQRRQRGRSTLRHSLAALAFRPPPQSDGGGGEQGAAPSSPAVAVPLPQPQPLAAEAAAAALLAARRRRSESFSGGDEPDAGLSSPQSPPPPAVTLGSPLMLHAESFVVELAGDGGSDDACEGSHLQRKVSDGSSVSLGFDASTSSVFCGGGGGGGRKKSGKARLSKARAVSAFGVSQRRGRLRSKHAGAAPAVAPAVTGGATEAEAEAEAEAETSLPLPGCESESEPQAVVQAGAAVPPPPPPPPMSDSSTQTAACDGDARYFAFAETAYRQAQTLACDALACAGAAFTSLLAQVFANTVAPMQMQVDALKAEAARLLAPAADAAAADNDAPCTAAAVPSPAAPLSPGVFALRNPPKCLRGGGASGCGDGAAAAAAAASTAAHSSSPSFKRPAQHFYRFVPSQQVHLLCEVPDPQGAAAAGGVVLLSDADGTVPARSPGARYTHLQRNLHPNIFAGRCGGLPVGAERPGASPDAAAAAAAATGPRSRAAAAARQQPGAKKHLRNGKAAGAGRGGRGGGVVLHRQTLSPRVLGSADALAQYTAEHELCFVAEAAFDAAADAASVADGVDGAAGHAAADTDADAAAAEDDAFRQEGAATTHIVCAGTASRVELSVTADPRREVVKPLVSAVVVAGAAVEATKKKKKAESQFALWVRHRRTCPE